MLVRIHDLPVHSRALLSLAINAALALGWNGAAATAPPVTNCNSSGTGSLSAAISDPMTADGDVIDMTGLKTVCSRITVADIAIHKDLILEGPGAKYLMIDGENSARLLHHDGMGTLVISAVTLANGSYSSASKANGGCIHSTGSLSLIDAEVSHCEAKSSNDRAFGGAIYTQGDLHLLRSTITESHARAAGSVVARGGGAYAKGNFTALYSTISNNTAGTGVDKGYGLGGGVATEGDVDIEHSTISANKADAAGGSCFDGGTLHNATIADSTISGNTGSEAVGGIYSTTVLEVSNSTIAFNQSVLGSANNGAGLYSTGPVVLVSSIIAGNGAKDGANDFAATGLVDGSNNLVFKSSSLPPGNNNITSVCPQLDVLADNGGPTLTHGLKPTSAAIDKGSAAMGLTIDQRLEPRITGQQADIGAVEWKQTDQLERVFVGGFDGLCDQ
jgi:hypothetical protein